MDPQHLQLLGKSCALLTAITWAMALVLFKRCTDEVSPLALNLFKNVVGLILLAATLAVMGGAAARIGDFPIEDIYILALSGVVGIALADTLFLRALDLIGVGIISIVDCLYSPFVILFSIMILPESLTLSLVIGALLILGGVFISSRHAPPPNRTRAQVVTGVLLGGFTMGLMAIGIVIAKLVLEGNDFPLIWATTVRLAAGTASLALVALASPRRRALWAVFKPAAIWRVSVPASVLGTYVAMVLWIAGFKYTSASVASILNQTSVVFAVVFATLFLKEQFTSRKLISLLLALGGAILVTLAAG